MSDDDLQIIPLKDDLQRDFYAELCRIGAEGGLSSPPWENDAIS